MKNRSPITVRPTDKKLVEFELWFALGNATVLLKVNKVWKNVKELYEERDGRILIDKIQLELVD